MLANTAFQANGKLLKSKTLTMTKKEETDVRINNEIKKEMVDDDVITKIKDDWNMFEEQAPKIDRS